jgi:hypothetical protein
VISMNALSIRGFRVCIAFILSLASQSYAQQDHSVANRVPHSRLIERVSFDWNHSGTPTTFSLFREGQDDPILDRLVISAPASPSWSFKDHDGGWASTLEGELAHLKKQNLLPASRHFFFVSSGSPETNAYLILKGVESGCCVGSLTVITPDEQGKPTVVFHASNHLLAAIEPIDGSHQLALIGQPSDSEAWALKNAQSYDPYRVYVLDRDQPARYDLARSKAYTLAHYCEWVGSKYNEKFVAVGVPTGANHCKVMSGTDFSAYQQKHPERLPEPK